MCGIFGLGLAPECIIESLINIAMMVFGGILLLVGILLLATGKRLPGVVVLILGVVLLALGGAFSFLPFGR